MQNAKCKIDVETRRGEHCSPAKPPSDEGGGCRRQTEGEISHQYVTP